MKNAAKFLKEHWVNALWYMAIGAFLDSYLDCGPHTKIVFMVILLFLFFQEHASQAPRAASNQSKAQQATCPRY